MKSKIFLGVSALLIGLSAAWAEPLSLSDAQIQTLKKYNQGNAPNPLIEVNALVWKGDPLSVGLPLNAEKRVIFPEAIEANLNNQLKNDQLRIINNDNSLYLTALQSFNATRIYVTLKQSQKIVLIDLVTSDKATPTTETVTLLSSKPSSVSSTFATANTTFNASTSFSSTNDISKISTANHYVDAIRFAWQQLYSPRRLLNQNTPFTRTPMHTQLWVSHLVYGDKVFAHPQVSWISSNNNFYVTAVELRNKYVHPTTIDLQRDICGQWIVATLYPRASLKAAGSKPEDSTTLFLISSKPFAKALEDCDASA